MKRISILLILTFVLASVVRSQYLPLTPYPQSITFGEGKLTVPNQISYNNSKISSYVKEELESFGYTTTIGSADNAFIRFNLSPSSMDKEEYQLTIGEKGVDIKASTDQGLFYGFQTLKQLLDNLRTDKTLQYLTIEDKPAFSWRAMHFDDSRHFKGKEVVKNMLDEMANLKMNIFHWHLTDDQGWRIQIDKYPLLTEIGSKRDSTQIGGHSKSLDYKIEPHSGFYTKDDIREVIAYAEKLHITIVPEIEMPGHASAAIAAYPWLGTTKEGSHVEAKFGVFENIFDVSNPRVITFLQDVIDEVAALFPGDVIHIGGDEARYTQWINSKKVTSFMKKNKLDTHTDLQIWFTNNMSRYIEKKGKRMMGWNEITGDKIHNDFDEHSAPQNTELGKNTIVHFWKGDLELVEKTAKSGYSIVNSYHFFTYMDYNYRTLSMEKSYSFSPIPEGLPEEYNHLILGLGAQSWSEWLPTESDLYRQVFPRLAAYAEVGWTQSTNKSWERFSRIVNNNFMPKLQKRAGKRGIVMDYDALNMVSNKVENN